MSALQPATIKDSALNSMTVSGMRPIARMTAPESIVLATMARATRVGSMRA